MGQLLFALILASSIIEVVTNDTIFISIISFNTILEINSIILTIAFDSIILEEIPTTSLHFDDLKPHLEIH